MVPRRIGPLSTGPLVVAIEAVRVDPVQNFHGVPRPLGHQRGRGPGIEPPGNSRVAEIVGLRASGEATCAAVNARTPVFCS